MNARTVVLLVGVAFRPGPAVAQDRPRADLSGSLRGGYWSSTRDLDTRAPLGAGMVWLKATVPLVGSTSLLAEGWSALRGPPDGAEATTELREGYLAVSFGPADARLGRQILAWGRADGVNPTGNLTGEDLTLLTPEDADRRLGTTAATVTGYFGGVSVSGLWLPEFRGHRFPLPSQAGITFDRLRPEWPGDQWAVRVERAGGRIDWSVSWFQGLDLQPDLGPASTPGRITLRHHRLRIFGADAATTLGRFGLRAEGAYVQTEDDTGTDPFTKDPFLFVVLGGDRTFRGTLNMNLQYLLRVATSFHPESSDTLSTELRGIADQEAILSSQTRQVQHGASMRASYSWLHETLTAECAAVVWAGPRGAVIRPKVTYAATDKLTMTAGIERYRGSNTSLFRLLRPNSAGFVEFRWGF